jgi:hypothetical protein
LFYSFFQCIGVATSFAQIMKSQKESISLCWSCQWEDLLWLGAQCQVPTILCWLQLAHSGLQVDLKK